MFDLVFKILFFYRFGRNWPFPKSCSRDLPKIYQNMDRMYIILLISGLSDIFRYLYLE